MAHAALRRNPVLVFAHRGGAALRPENTLAAFDHGLSVGADGLELDVRLSRDGEVVVIHDATLDRTTDATGPVSARTADELARVDAGCRFGEADGFPWRGCGLGVPRLREVLARMPPVPLIVEMKEDSAGLAARIVEAVRVAGATDRVVLGSFLRMPMRTARALAPDLPTGATREEVRWALHRSRIGWNARRRPYRALQVPQARGWTQVLSPRFIRAAHASGVVVQVWTVDDERDMRRLLSWGVDGLITDRPDVAVRVVHGNARGMPAECPRNEPHARVPSTEYRASS